MRSSSVSPTLAISPVPKSIASDRRTSNTLYPSPGADPARLRAAVTHEQRDHVVRMPGRDPHRNRLAHLAALILQSYEVRELVAALSYL